MKKIFNKKVFNSIICLVLSAVLVITGMPVDSLAAPNEPQLMKVTDLR